MGVVSQTFFRKNCVGCNYNSTNHFQSLEVCSRELTSTYAREKKLGRFTSAMCDKLKDGIHLTTDLNLLKDCELVIEAVFEKMKLKTELFARLSEICSSATIFATNTSSLNIDEMSAALHKREYLVGMHFFNPAHIIRMVEVVHGKHTSAKAVATVFAVCDKMKKLPVLVGNCPSFVFNRLLGVYLNQAQKLLYQYGMFPNDVDALLKSFGLMMGPCTVADMNGLDVAALLKSEHNYPLNPIEKELLRLKRLGRKTG
ncbi:3-hydroxybutyryl-CoA dehydrogenase [Trichostrongylus colubriformis]|uniref:3-hydroxybutyryl-CoA dehydrogenase n=1 Tax=Trichostrongylus colubriformis TaxID=6319 RepID=A0AAN8J249_TRICO